MNYKYADLVRIISASKPTSKIAAGSVGEIFYIGEYLYKVWFPTYNAWLWLTDKELIKANENNNTTK